MDLSTMPTATDQPERLADGRRPGTRRLLTSMLALAGLSLAGCSAGEAVTTRSLRASRQIWNKANIQDYNLEWTATGAQQAHYLVSVRSGRVASIRSLIRDREGRARELDVHPADPSYYSVDGLFKTIEREMDEAAS